MDTLVSTMSVVVKKMFTKNRSDVHYLLTDFNLSEYGIKSFGYIFDIW